MSVSQIEDRNEYGLPDIIVDEQSALNFRAFIDRSVNKPMPWLVIIAIIAGLSLGFAIPAYIQSTKTRDELLIEIQRSEARVIEDNRQKTTQFTLLDSHYRELKAMVDAREKLKDSH